MSSNPLAGGCAVAEKNAPPRFGSETIRLQAAKKEEKDEETERDLEWGAGKGRLMSRNLTDGVIGAAA